MFDARRTLLEAVDVELWKDHGRLCVEWEPCAMHVAKITSNIVCQYAYPCVQAAGQQAYHAWL